MTLTPCISQEPRLPVGTGLVACGKMPAEHATNVSAALAGDWNGTRHHYCPFSHNVHALRLTERGTALEPAMVFMLPTSARNYHTLLWDDGEVERVDSSYIMECNEVWSCERGK